MKKRRPRLAYAVRIQWPKGVGFTFLIRAKTSDAAIAAYEKLGYSRGRDCELTVAVYMPWPYVTTHSKGCER